MKNGKRLLAGAVLLSLSLALVGCGGSKKGLTAEGAKDGTYEVSVSSTGENPATQKLTLKIKDQKITEAELVELDAQNNPKLLDLYGKDFGEQNFKLAQKAVKGILRYPQLLVEKQDLSKVDAVSGATVSHKLFVEAVTKALEEAKK